VVLFAAACSSSANRITIDISRRAPLAAVKTATPLAGVAKADITPAPGMPLAGYSIVGMKGTGFRSKLYARVIYVKPKDGSPVALVQCDLLTGARLLHHRIAEMVAAKTDVPLEGILITGTHTHSGPGSYFDDIFYNGFASAKGGFDPKYFDFLAQRISDAIIEAYNNRRPAKTASGTVDIWNAAWNRSMKAYAGNFKDGTGAEKDKYRAVNPTLYLLRVDIRDERGIYRPAGAFSSFSLHPTVLPEENDLYNGDIFAAVERSVEWKIEDEYKTGRSFVYAAANGTHGDTTPNYDRRKRGFGEAHRIGTEIGAKAFDLFRSLDGKLSEDVPVRFTAREIDVFKDRSIDGISLADHPVVGQPLTAGSTEDSFTPVVEWMPFFREGWGSARWIFTGSDQGHKRHVAGLLQGMILPKLDFPHIMFLQTVRIGDLVLLAAPFEITLEAGKMIKEGYLKEAKGQDKCDVAVVSVSNGYFGYTTAPGEYAKQHYEGGHTLFGPNSTPFLAAQFGRLAREFSGTPEPSALPDRWQVSLKKKEFYPAETAPSGKRALTDQPLYREKKKNAEPCWEFSWQDVPPAMIDFHRPLVAVEQSADGATWEPVRINGRPVDDSGLALSVRFSGKTTREGMGRYIVRWNSPAQKSGVSYRFVVLPRGSFGVFYSPAFTNIVPPEKL
jgi:neutral ceramidase